MRDSAALSGGRHGRLQHGRPDDGSDAAAFKNAEVFVLLKPFEEWPRGV